MGEMSIRNALEEFKNIYLAARNYAPRSREEYINDLDDFVSFLENYGCLRVGELGIPQVDRYLAELDRRGLAGSTRKRKTITIRTFLTFLYREKIITNDISQKIIIPLSDPVLPRVLTKAEYEGLIKACADNIRDTAIIQMLLQTGIKLSELVRTRLQDIDISPPEGQIGGLSGQMRVNGRQGRNLPLNSKVVQVLQDYLNARPSTAVDSLFVTKTGVSLGERGLQKMIQKYLDLAGIKNASVESLRHTFAAHHVAKGTDIKTVQEILGHQDSRSTQIYFTMAQQLRQQELELNAL